MKALCYPFLFLAAGGFLLSLAAHLLALAGKTPPGGGLVWGLHLGIFVVWLPMALSAKFRSKLNQPKGQWKAQFEGCPVWMARALQVVFAYALLNFALFLIATAGHPKPKGAAPPAVIRGFSGHWMAFYGTAFAALYTTLKRRSTDYERRGSENQPLGRPTKPSG